MNVILSLIFSFGLFAQTCGDETTLNWILSEFDSHHPRMILQRLHVEKVEAGKAEASKIINPELEHFSVWGKEFGGMRAYNNETRLWFTLQLASKRNKSIDAWSKETQMAMKEEELLKQALLKDLWLNFFRLHQIYKEISVKKVIISKLQKVTANYKARRFLSPDMRMEERIFTMVTKNFSLTLDQLERERLGILGFFREITAFKCPIKKITSEDTDIKWPNVATLNELGGIEPLNIQLAKTELEFAQSKSVLAEARKTPNLRLSPIVQNYINKDVNNSMAGVSFVFPLPVFDRNQSERLQTILDQKYAERKIEITKLKEDYLFEVNLKKYTNGLSVLEEVGEIDKSLAVMETLASSFAEGKISIPNIVEFCRQLDEMVLRYHFGESVLMRDLMDLYEQRGLLNKKSLEDLI